MQQALEENNTANILLCLSEKNEVSNGNNSDCNSPSSSSFMNDSVPELNYSNSHNYIRNNNSTKGNIIDQLRSIVRAEAAIYLKPKFESTFNNHFCVSNITSGDNDEYGSDIDLDEVVDPTSNSRGTTEWKNGSIFSSSGVDNKFSPTDEHDSLR